MVIDVKFVVIVIILVELKDIIDLIDYCRNLFLVVLDFVF